MSEPVPSTADERKARMDAASEPLRVELLPYVTDILTEVGCIDTRWYTEQGRDRGSALHLALRFYDEGDLEESSVDPSIVEDIEKYKRWLAREQPQILAIEEPAVNAVLGYQTRGIDRRMLLSGHNWIVDYKKGRADCWHPLQTAFYAGCFPKVHHRRGVLSFAGPDARLIEHVERDWETAKAVLTVYNWRKRWRR